MKKPIKKETKKMKPKAGKPAKIAAKATKLVKPSMNNGLGVERPTISGIDPYEVESAARTIQKAEEHKKNSKLMAAVKAHVKSLSDAVGGLK